MDIVCLDLEGTLVPEIWIAFAEAAGIPELRVTTRDEPDYDRLMRRRLAILRERGVGLAQIQDVIRGIRPFEGARAFLDELRGETQAVIVSDTFTQFAGPLVEQLGSPMIFCNELVVGDDGMIEGYRMRCDHMKRATVEGLQHMGYDTIAAGDSLNDLEMIRASKAGFLFRASDAIRQANPDVTAIDAYDDLLAAIRANL